MSVASYESKSFQISLSRCLCCVSLFPKKWIHSIFFVSNSRPISWTKLAVLGERTLRSLLDQMYVSEHFELTVTYCPWK